MLQNVLSTKSTRRHILSMKQTFVGAGVIFADGYLSGVVGDPRGTNPQRSGSDAASVWLEGWDEGKAERVQKAAPEPRKPPSR